MTEENKIEFNQILENKRKEMETYDDMIPLITKEAEYYEALARLEEARLRTRVAQYRLVQITAPSPESDEGELKSEIKKEA